MGYKPMARRDTGLSKKMERTTAHGGFRNRQLINPNPEHFIIMTNSME
jgi:hypothetical protein